MISWTNRLGGVSSVLSLGKLEADNWVPVATVTTEDRTLQWLDESPQSAARFYSVVHTTETNQAARLQAALERTRRSLGVRGASAAVLTTNGLWLGASGISFGSTSLRPWMRFSMGSVTKTFVAALILQLAE